MSSIVLMDSGLKVTVSPVEDYTVLGTVTVEILSCIITDPKFQVILIPEESVGKSRDGCVDGTVDPDSMKADIDTTQARDGKYLLYVNASPREVNPLGVPEIHKVEMKVTVMNG